MYPPLSSELSITRAIPNFDSLKRTWKSWFISKLKEWLKLLYRADLDVRDRDVEELVHIRKPNHPNIRHNHGPQIALVAEKYRFIFCPFSSKVWSSQKGWWTSPWEIPNPIYGGDNLLQGQQLQATSLYHQIKSVIWFKLINLNFKMSTLHLSLPPEWLL